MYASSGLHDHYSDLFTWTAAVKLSPYSRYQLEINIANTFCLGRISNSKII